MDNSKFLKIIIVVLLLLNTGTLAFMWTNNHRMGPPPPPPHERQDVFEFLTYELKFNDEQRNQYDQLRKEHHKAIEAIQENGRSTHDNFYALLQNKSADSALVSQLADSISYNQKQIELLTFYHFQKVRAICNHQQQKKFDEVIRDALHMMFPKPPTHR